MVDVSFIIPVYNVRSLLPQCVASVQAQTLPDIEILLVDDGSTDGSGALCDALAAQDRRIRVLHKPNGGASTARNCGLELAQGRYVSFVDSDDCIDPRLAEDNLHLADAEDADLVVFGYYKKYASPAGAVLYEGTADPLALSGAFSYAEFWERFEQAQYMTFSVVRLYRRAYLERFHLRFRPLRYGEDAFFLYCMYDCPFERIVFHPRPYYHYLIRRGSTMTGFKPEVLDCQMQIGRQYSAVVRRHEPSPGRYEHLVLHRYLAGTVMAADNLARARRILPLRRRVQLLRDFCGQPEIQDALRRRRQSGPLDRRHRVQAALLAGGHYRAALFFGQAVQGLRDARWAILLRRAEGQRSRP